MKDFSGRIDLSSEGHQSWAEVDIPRAAIVSLSDAEIIRQYFTPAAVMVLQSVRERIDCEDADA
jgi:hypothetical protein